MTKDGLNDKYFKWMCRLVCDRRYFKGQSYRKLLSYLHSIDFTYTIGMDGNRAEDGTDLRYRFGYEQNLEGPIIAAHLDNRPCSVLEMLVALSVRCEEHIMDNPEIGDRTGRWFWSMIKNLGLDSMTDSNFNEKHVDEIITRFLNREYGSNGEGGLFAIPHCSCDLRSVDIWYQMMWYLRNVLKN